MMTEIKAKMAVTVPGPVPGSGVEPEPGCEAVTDRHWTDRHFP